MFRVHIKINGVETNYLDLPTQAEAEAYIQDITASQHWGRNTKLNKASKGV